MPRSGSKAKESNAEPAFRMERPVDFASRSSRAEPNWYLRFVVSVSICGLAALAWIRSDLGLMAWDSLKALPSPYSYSSNWHGQDARNSGVDREAATKRPPPSEESFLATFRGRASSPN